MNKILLTIILILTAFNLNAQGKKSIYVDNNSEYAVFLEPETKMSDKVVDDADIKVFANKKGNRFNYTLLFSKIYKHDFIDGNLLDNKYESFYKSTCNCEILDKEIVYYKNIKTLRFKIEVKRGENVFWGYVDSFVSDFGLYNILFLSKKDDFDANIARHTDTLNTFIFNGKTTINGYKK